MQKVKNRSGCGCCGGGGCDPCSPPAEAALFIRFSHSTVTTYGFDYTLTWTVSDTFINARSGGVGGWLSNCLPTPLAPTNCTASGDFRVYCGGGSEPPGLTVVHRAYNLSDCTNNTGCRGGSNLGGGEADMALLEHTCDPFYFKWLYVSGIPGAANWHVTLTEAP